MDVATQNEHMLTDIEKADIRAAIAGLARSLPGYRERRAQLVMMGAVAKAFAAGNTEQPGPSATLHRYTVLHSPTGSGKTMAIVPGLVLARQRKKQLIISTSSVALQGQLVSKDLPALQAIMPFDFTFATSKGRSRYVCTERLLEKAEEAGRGSAQEKIIPLRRSVDGETVTWLADQLTQGRWDGKYESLAVKVTDELWDSVTTDRHGCARRKCPQFASCPYFAARAKAKKADLIVTNHDLLVASASTPDDTVLPSPENSYLLLDEAHALPHRAAQRLSVEHEVRSTMSWVEGLEDLVDTAVQVCGLDVRVNEVASAAVGELTTSLQDLDDALMGNEELRLRGSVRFRSALPQDLALIGAPLRRSAGAAASVLAACVDALAQDVSVDPKLAARLRSKLGKPLGRLESIVATWDLLLGEEVRPTARWAEKLARRNGTTEFKVSAAPVSAAEKLHESLWSRVLGVAALSATIKAFGGFSLFLEESGLSLVGRPKLLELPSPFDYPSQAALIVPPMTSDPRDARAHTAEVTSLLPSLITSKGTLVLFTSLQMMRAVEAGLPDEVRASVMLQGSMGKKELLARHRERVARGERSIMFGSASLSEGGSTSPASC